MRPSALLLVAAACCAGQSVAAGQPATIDNEFCDKKVRPLLFEHCHAGHSARAKKLKGGLRLDTRADILKGGDSGPAVVPGRPEKSLLIKAVRQESESLQMPPKGKLPARAIVV